MNEERNRKLALWAGFYLSNVKAVYRYLRDKREPCWLNPNGTVAYGITGRGSYPNFTSLDACFKWLVPEVLQKHPNATIEVRVFQRDGVMRAIAVIQDAYKVLAQSLVVSEPAEALCEAIEQLIDKEQAL